MLTRPWQGYGGLGRNGLFARLSLLIGLLLAGCATQTPVLLRSPQGLPQHAELVATPYFAQESHQCGPASLAMVLGSAGIRVTPEALEAQVYVPLRLGSLQPEMLAAARRQGALALRVKPQPDAVLNEVAHGHPVLVLQNLGLSWLPRWHYAVVIGYDLPNEEIILRSGPNSREPLAMTTFEHTWARSGYWAMLALAPGELPADADPVPVVSALSALEKYADAEPMVQAYTTALTRWPETLALQIGLGNSAYRSGDLLQAESVFRVANESHPDNAVVLNNLASVLQRLGRLDEALLLAERAAAIAGPWQAQSLATRNAIRATLQSQAHGASQ